MGILGYFDAIEWILGRMASQLASRWGSVDVLKHFLSSCLNTSSFRMMAMEGVTNWGANTSTICKSFHDVYQFISFSFNCTFRSTHVFIIIKLVNIEINGCWLVIFVIFPQNAHQMCHGKIGCCCYAWWMISYADRKWNTTMCLQCIASCCRCAWHLRRCWLWKIMDLWHARIFFLQRNQKSVKRMHPLQIRHSSVRFKRKEKVTEIKV